MLDRVASQISAMASSARKGRMFMRLQAFFDESVDDSSGIFVLAGAIASAESWYRFTDEWERMSYRNSFIQESGNRCFKMAEMSASSEMRGFIPAYAEIVKKHVAMIVSAKINTRDLEAARRRVFSPGICFDLDRLSNPYNFCFRLLMDRFHQERGGLTEFIGEGIIDFYFDDRHEKKAIIEMWSDYLDGRPQEQRRYFGATPRFEGDEQYPPLQAADLIAGSVRLHYKRNDIRDSCGPFGLFYAGDNDSPLLLEIEANEDDIANSIIDVARSSTWPTIPIYDLGRS